MGFPMHPHRDMEILTYVLSGELEHQDTMGNRGVVGPGGIQFMSAGTGVRHSEYNARRDAELHLVQMWVLPGKLDERPSYGQKDFTLEDRRGRWLTVASGEAGKDAPITLTQNGTLRVARLENTSLTHEMSPERYGFLFVHEGELSANDQKLGAGDAVRMSELERLDLQGSGEVVFWDVPAA
jgi:redox-sensitive bicupin YhaK (pirin superfamily)